VTSRRHQHSSSSIHEDNHKECTIELDLKHIDTNIATLTFNRPNAANAMGRTMLSQLQDAVSFLSGEKGKKVRCALLTSSSPTVFSAGADLRERSKMSMEEAAAFVTELRNTLDDIASLPMPLIACIEVWLNLDRSI
jgi:methylglutaconyl-CoA hydratase